MPFLHHWCGLLFFGGFLEVPPALVAESVLAEDFRTVADVAGAVVVPSLALGLAGPPVIPLVVFAPQVGQMAVPSASLAPQILHFGIVVSSLFSLFYFKPWKTTQIIFVQYFL